MCLVILIQDVVDSHPGLGFLKEATEFHSRYVHTVSEYLYLSFLSIKIMILGVARNSSVSSMYFISEI